MPLAGDSTRFPSRVADELVERPGVEVLVSGGRLRSGDLALSSSHTTEFFGDIYADVAFLGSGGIDAGAGLTDFHLEEAAARRVILRNAREAYVLADSSKFGLVARYRVAELDEVTGLITETQPDNAIREALGDASVLASPITPTS